MTTLYGVQSNGLCRPTEEWERWLRRRCHMCPFIRAADRAGPIDIHLASCDVDIYPLTGVSPGFVDILRSDLLDCWSSLWAPGFHIGSVFNASGDRLDDAWSVVAHTPLPIRGGPKSKWSRCEHCGRFRYSATGDVCILQRDLTGAELYEAGISGGGFIVSEPVLQMLPAQIRRTLFVKRVEVRHEPLDGLTDWPEDYF